METQQSSDVTYRFYDYDRLENGKKRQLHIEKSLDVTTAPFVNLSILAGEGTLDGQPVKKGDHMVLTADYGKAVLEGNMEFIYSHI